MMKLTEYIRHKVTLYVVFPCDRKLTKRIATDLECDIHEVTEEIIVISTENTLNVIDDTILDMIRGG